MGVEIINLDRLISKLESLGGNSQAMVKSGVTELCFRIQGDAKDLCPVAEHAGGTLRDSIIVEVNESSGKVVGEVGTNVEYAAYVEYGTGSRGADSPSPPKAPNAGGYTPSWKGMAAQPFLYPALINRKDQLPQIIRSKLRQEIGRLGG